ncbi:hypothetical protein B9D94_28755 [Paenibacillus sp. Cedars]|nr:hypothetical protein B9D94_28755 [Paenibacillus sp. Cedars]
MLAIDNVHLKQTGFQDFKTGMLYTALVFLMHSHAIKMYTQRRQCSSTKTLYPNIWLNRYHHKFDDYFHCCDDMSPGIFSLLIVQLLSEGQFIPLARRIMPAKLPLLADKLLTYTIKKRSSLWLGWIAGTQ